MSDQGDSSTTQPEALELMMASLRADAADLDTFFEVLVDKLAGSLGERVSVGRASGLFRRERRPSKVTVSAGERSLEAEMSKGRIVCLVRHQVRGVVLKSEEVTLDQWLGVLARALSEEAERSAATRAALESLLA